MEGVHDGADIRSGYAYSESVAQCVCKAVGGKAGDDTPCTDQLTRWLGSGKLSDTRNLYARALLFNQHDIIAAAEPHIKASDVQFENVFNLYKGAIDRLDNREAAKLIDRLALTTGNVILNAIKETSYPAMRGVASLHLHLLSNGVFKLASNVSANDLTQWVMQETRASGIKLATNRTQTRLDARTEARQHVKPLPADRKLYAYELDIAKLEQEGRIAPGSVKSIKLPGVTAMEKWLGSSAPREFHLGMVVALVQAFACCPLCQDSCRVI